MATINYYGIELEELNPDKTIPFNPPIKCVGWNNKDVMVEFELSCALSKEIWHHRFIGKNENNDPVAFRFCALLPEKPKPRRATWKELAYWLIDGKGLVLDENRGKIDTGVIFSKEDLDAEVSDYLKVMLRDDADWHEPDVQYMGIEDYAEGK